MTTRPVLVGIGQLTDKPDDPRRGLEPLAFLEAAARAALDDAGVRAAALDTVAVVTNVFHDYGDTATMLAERLDAHPTNVVVTTWGGNTPQTLLSHLCDEIAADRIDVALLAGGEAGATMRGLGRAGITPAWTPPRETSVPRFGDMRYGTSGLESRHGCREAYATFAVIENAYRASRGLSIADAQAEMGAFAARCTEVAAANPYAWFREARDAATLATVGPSNRMVAFPYPKYLNAIMDVNQGAALLVTSESAARRLGIPEHRWVWPWGAIDVTEQWFLSERDQLGQLPGMRRGGAMLLDELQVSLEDIQYLDLYSCFPVASRLSASMLGIDPATTRPLTLTGGLPWFGGPGNNYATHAIASAVERLRADRTGRALVHALGWSCTKHAIAVYGAEPRPAGWHRSGGAALQEWIESQPRPAIADEPTGRGTVDAYTVVHGRGGAAERGIVLGRLDDGRRFVAALPADADVLTSFEVAEGVGRTGRLTSSDGRNTFEPS
jgi:acetyl-CoA C-acetyltransferase